MHMVQAGELAHLQQGILAVIRAPLLVKNMVKALDSTILPLETLHGRIGNAGTVVSRLTSRSRLTQAHT